MKHVITGLRSLLMKMRTLHLIKLPGVPFITAAATVVVFAGGSAAALATNDQLRTTVVEKLSVLADNKPKSVDHPAPVTTKNADADAKTPPSPTTPVTKYAISPDPRSTAYSLTPPKPSLQDFTITVTHAGQVAPGTKIVYSVEKEYTVYYGGDMAFSSPTITLHRSVTLFADTTVSTPDGLPMTAPTNPWYGSSPNAWISAHGDPGSVSASWPITLQFNSSLPNGTYQAHITAWRSGGTSHLEWEYDGFVTLVVED